MAVAAGDLAAAREHFQAALGTWTQLILMAPASAQWQRAPSFSRNKLGHIAVAAGDLGAACDHHKAVLHIAERLATADPPTPNGSAT